MCDKDCGSDEGLDVGTDFDINEETDYSSDFDEIGEGSSFEALDDMNDSSEDCSEVTDSFSDMEPEDFEESPTLEEYSDLIDEADDVEELSDIKATLISGELSVKGMEREDSGIFEYDEADEEKVEDIELELTFTQEELYELSTEHSDELEFESRIEELEESGRIVIVEPDKLEELKDDGDCVKIFTRESTPEIIESRERDIEEVLDNYRENLQERGVPDEQIKEFINQERDKMNAEYESLDQGNLAENIYYEPTDWDVAVETIVEHNDDEIAEDFTNEAELGGKISENLLINEISEVYDEMQDDNLSISDLPDAPSDVVEEEEVGEGLEGMENTENEDIDTCEIEENIFEDVAEESVDIEASEEVEETTEILAEELENPEVFSGDNTEGIVNETQELNINYDEIYEEIEQEALEQGFENIDIYEDSERLDSSLENFKPLNWEALSLERRKESISTLAEYVEDVIGFDNPPRIEYYNNHSEGDYGGYNSRTNTLSINEYMLYNSGEAADTIAHELWHAHQRECAENPQLARDYQYQYNFQNYIRPEMGHEAYENQLIEAEARAFAAQFKERLTEMRGRSR